MSDRNYAALRSPEAVETLIDKIIASGKPFAFDIEAGYDGPDAVDVSKKQFYPTYKLVGISFTVSTEWARYVPIAHDDGNNATDIPRVARAFWRLVRTGMGVAHNVSYELKGMSRWFRETLWWDPEVGAEVRESRGFFPFLTDTMILVWLSAMYEPKVSDVTQKDLKTISRMAFGLVMTNFLDLFPATDSDMGPATKRGKSKVVRFNTRYSTSPKVIAYACEDSVACLMLFKKHWEALKDEYITKVEMALVQVLIDMEIGPVDENGKFHGNMLLDWKQIHTKLLELGKFRDKMAEEILQELGERLDRVVTLNLNSTDQMKKILYGEYPEGLGLPINDKFRSKKTKEPSTGEDALKVLAKADPIIRKILDYRQVVKLYGSYLNKYETELNYAGTGVVFPNHNQAGALTGRMSVDQVSYQQWPKPYHYELKDGTTFDMSFRDLLLSPKDHRIIGFDYSQVELRVLASVAHEKAMLKAFSEGVDIHRATASMMLKVPLDQVVKKIRAKGKTLNFGVVYGLGPDAMAEDLSASGELVTKEDAEELLRQYFAAFSGLKNWIDARVAEGREQGYVRTPFGRKFTVWEYRDHRNWIRNKGDRMCVNAPIQGGAADYIKTAMVRAWKAIRKAEAEGVIPKDSIRMFMTIHDALEFYVHKSVSTQTVIDLLGPCVSFPTKILPGVEILAEWHECKTWGQIGEIKLKDGKIDHFEIEDVEEHFDTIEDVYRYFDKAGEPPVEPSHEERDLVVPEASPDDDDLPPWAASPEFRASQSHLLTEPAPQLHAHITMDDQPDEDQWEAFESWLKPGTVDVSVEMPDGVLHLDGQYDVQEADQGTISLLLGGAGLQITQAVLEPSMVGEGIEL